jgi:hypothetical protein
MQLRPPVRSQTAQPPQRVPAAASVQQQQMRQPAAAAQQQHGRAGAPSHPAADEAAAVISDLTN